MCPEDKDVVLICQKATAAMTVRGSTFDKTCSMCSQGVMIAPSGQALLARRPDAVVVCNECVTRLMAQHGPPEKVVAAASPEELRRELDDVIPNSKAID